MTTGLKVLRIGGVEALNCNNFLNCAERWLEQYSINNKELIEDAKLSNNFGVNILNSDLDLFYEKPKCALKKNSRCYSNTVYIDICSFKAYNDRLSESVGDAILSFFSKQLLEFHEFYNMYNDGLMPERKWAVARKGGDEFQIYGYSLSIPCIGKICNTSELEANTLKEILECYQKRIYNKKIEVWAANNDASSIKSIANDLCNETELKFDERYSFRYTIKNFTFRCGVHSIKSESYDEKQDPSFDGVMKDSETESRGMFHYCLKIFNTEKGEWLDLNEHVVFIVLVDKIDERVRDMLDNFTKEAIRKHYQEYGLEFEHNVQIWAEDKAWFIAMKIYTGAVKSRLKELFSEETLNKIEDFREADKKLVNASLSNLSSSEYFYKSRHDLAKSLSDAFSKYDFKTGISLRYLSNKPITNKQ